MAYTNALMVFIKRKMGCRHRNKMVFRRVETKNILKYPKKGGRLLWDKTFTGAHLILGILIRRYSRFCSPKPSHAYCISLRSWVKEIALEKSQN